MKWYWKGKVEGLDELRVYDLLVQLNVLVEWQLEGALQVILLRPLRYHAHVVDDGGYFVAARLVQISQDAGYVGAAIVLTHEIDEVDEVLLDELVRRVEALLTCSLLLLLLVEFIVLVELLRFLLALPEIGTASRVTLDGQLLAVQALLGHFEWHLQLH